MNGFVRPLRKGEPVEIIAVKHQQHAWYIGRRGLVRRYIKSRGLYEIEMSVGVNLSERTEWLPQNLRAVNDGAIGYGGANV